MHKRWEVIQLQWYPIQSGTTTRHSGGQNSQENRNPSNWYREGRDRVNMQFPNPILRLND